jgi:glycosyltransferase involved in cell wall biosynthesis
MALKKLLMVSYYFPPLGMGGTQRPAKLAKYLPEFGWQPTVLTVKPIAYWAQDPSLLAELSDIPIIRTGSLDPQRLLAKWRGAQNESKIASTANGRPSPILRIFNEKLLPFFLIPDSKILWRFHAVQAACNIIQQEKFDALYTTSPPHSVQIIGRRVAKRCGLKWVADFRDNWTGGVVVHEPTPLQRWFNRAMQKSVLKAADAVISVTSGIRDELLREHAGNQDKFHLIANGFDESDFPKSNRVANDGKFIFCHCGSITAFSDPKPFIRALNIFRQKYADLAKRSLFQFVGYDALGNFANRVRQAGLEQMIEFVGYRPHREALQYLVNADALLLIARGKIDATFIPSKVFEYLGSRKPILALSNVHDTIDLLIKTGTATILCFEEYEKIADEIASFIKGSRSFKADSKWINQFNRRNQAGQVAAILNDLI